MRSAWNFNTIVCDWNLFKLNEYTFIFQTNATCPICRVEVKVWTQNKVCLFGPEQLNCRSSLVGRGTFLQYLFGDELELLSFIVCMHGLWVNQYTLFHCLEFLKLKFLFFELVALLSSHMKSFWVMTVYLAVCVRYVVTSLYIRKSVVFFVFVCI